MNVLSRLYAFIGSEELLESTSIGPARMLCFIKFCLPILAQAQGNFCDLVG